MAVPRRENLLQRCREAHTAGERLKIALPLLETEGGGIRETEQALEALWLVLEKLVKRREPTKND